MRVFCLTGFMAVMAASAAQADVITQTLQMAQVVRMVARST